MIYDVRNYGAIGNAKTLNTNAIQKAIDDCALKKRRYSAFRRRYIYDRFDNTSE